MKTLFLIEDEIELAKLIASDLHKKKIHTTIFASAEEYDEHISEGKKGFPDCYVIDWMLPGRPGIQLVTQIRKMDKYVPIFMLTGLSRHEHIRQGLWAGADDYITKPFDPEALSIRIKNAIDKGKAIRELTQSLGPAHEFLFDSKHNIARMQDQLISLTSCELEILKLLHRFRGRTLSRETIVSTISSDNDISARNVDVHVANLRKKIQKTKAMIMTIRGKGYKLEYT